MFGLLIEPPLEDRALGLLPVSAFEDDDDMDKLFDELLSGLPFELNNETTGELPKNEIEKIPPKNRNY